MLNLASPADRLQLVTSAAAAVSVHASWVDVDITNGAVTPGRTNTAIANAALTTVVAGPASPLQRNVRALHVHNARGAPSTDVTVQHSDGTIAVQLYKGPLVAGDSLEYTDANGFGGAIGLLSAFSTGDVKLTVRSAADPGWVMMDDGTIGDASSGASNRANDDCQALFTLLWAFPNTWAPVSGGRGLSAAADWTAHKTIQLLSACGRALGVAGSGAGLTARAAGATVGEEKHAQTVAEMPYHGHGVADGTHAHSVYDPTHQHVPADGMPFLTDNPYTGWYIPNSGDPAQPGLNATSMQYAYTGIGIYAAYSNISISPSGSSTPFNVLQPTLFINVMIKL